MGRGAAPLGPPARDERQPAVVPRDVDVLTAFQTAVIPCAGLGTRLAAVPAGVPKALLPLAGRTMLGHAIVEAREAGLKQIVLAAAPGRERQLEAEARRWADDVAVAVQPSPRGLADAIRVGARGLTGPFAVLLPDNLFHSPSPLAGLLALAQSARTHAVLVARYDAGRARGKGGSAPADVASLGGDPRAVRVTAVGVKQPKDRLELSGSARLDTPVGRYAFYPDIAQAIDAVERELPSDVELDDVPVLRRLALEGRLVGLLYDAPFFDVGNPEGYREAIARLGA